jgi:serine/threonine-protein kinase
MEWLDGETVAAQLHRSPAGLPIDDVVRYARQLADALDTAHTAGIVHRDLKPANLFVTRRGDIKILDFGLAKQVAFPAEGPDRATRTNADLTEHGAAVGTEVYMSPEQARAETVDHRSDLFSLGAVLYEMATGHRVFARTTPALTFDAILNRRPAPPRSINPALSPAIDHVIMRLLAKEPSARFQRASELLAALEAPSSGSAMPRVVDAAPSIAVLPLRNVSPDPEDEYFADGMTEAIIDELTRVDGLRVAARTSSFAFKSKVQDVAAVAAQLNVAHVLSGSLRKAGSQLRVTMELVDASTSFPIWSERYDRQAGDVFAIQDEIASAIAERLKVTLTRPDDITRVRRPTDNIEAYELYLKGRFLVGQRGGELRRGLQCFENALALDPSFALAHAGLGDAYVLLGFYGYVPTYEAMPRARRFAQMAIDLDPRLAEPHSTLMFVSWTYDWDWDRTRVEFDRAMALDPRVPATLLWHAIYLALIEGDFIQAIAEASRAVEIDPLSGSAHATFGTIQLCSGAFAHAQQSMERAMDLDPRMWVAYRYLGLLFMEQQRFDAAEEILTQGLAVSNRHPWIVAALAETYQRTGRTAQADALYAEMNARGDAGYIQPLYRAFIAAATRRSDEAFEWLERAYRERNTLPLLNHFLDVRGLTDDPRFKEILRRTGVKLAGKYR